MIAIGCDHAGFMLKKEIIGYLDQNGIEYVDVGTDGQESVDYPLYAKKVVNALLSGQCDQGILLCGTGIGISIAANRYEGIRAACCHDVFSAKATRLHNDANILAMGGRVIGPDAAVEVARAFLETDFSGESKHMKRIRLIEELAKGADYEGE